MRAPGLRLALVAGFGGMLLIFLLAATDAVRLLREMRAQNQVLRDASLERSRRLASVRTYVLMSQAYVGDYFMDSDEQRARDRAAELQQAWSRMLGELEKYPASTPEDVELLGRLRQMLDQHRQAVAHAMSPTSLERRRQIASFYSDEILPLRTTVLQITTRVQDADQKQLAASANELQRQFEGTGRRLSVVLEIALGTGLLLALGCVFYIHRIERQNQRRYEQIREARGALERLSARLVEAQEEERRSISRELHDEVGQTLSAVLVDAANLANRIPADDAVAQRYLESIRNLADSSVNSIRNIALLLRPSMLDDLGLIPALEWQAREVSRRHGIKVKVVDENVPASLPDAVRTCVYRVVQEALHNVSSHSKAKNVTIGVGQENGSLAVTVEDDGVGFDPERKKGLGLLGMEERVKQLGGRMEIRAEKGKGTRVRVVLPSKPAP
jgi:signal transduction histidine kinase